MTLATLFDAATLPLDGTTLVEASAGTGKTHAITLLVVRLMLEQKLEPSQILVMTFTEAATAELRVRIRRRLHLALDVLQGRLGELAQTDPDLLRVCARFTDAASLEHLKRAVADLDEAPITTIHGFCHRVLGEHALRTGTRYGAELVRDLEELDEDIVYDFWHRQVASSSEIFADLTDNPLARLRNLLREVRRHSRATLVPEASNPAMELDRDFVLYAHDELALRKERQGVFGFDDLLERLAAALAGPDGRVLADGLRSRFKAALIDEFQDTDPVQWDIARRVFAEGGLPLLLIGDPKQAIYGFRGADVFTYLAAAQGARRATMRVNWRSDPGLVSAVNQLFNPPETFVFPQIRHATIEPRPGVENSFAAPWASGTASLELLLVRRDDPGASLSKSLALHQMPRIVAAEIARLLAGGAKIHGRLVAASDVAVLTRSNEQCFLVQDALRDLGINSVVISDKSVWTSEEAVDLERALGGVLDPGSGSARKRALASTLIGENADSIDRLDDEPERLEFWLERFQRWQELWSTRGFLRMLRQLLREVKAPDRLLERQGGERRLTNLLHLGELLERASVERQLGPAALLDWLREQRRDEANRGEHSEIRLESDSDAVRVLTVHKSKGLEFPVVYCPFLWAGSLAANNVDMPRLFHEGGKALLDIDTDKERRQSHIDVTKREGVAEEIRLAYVALTRAQHRSSIIWVAANYHGASAFSFVWRPDPALSGGGELKLNRLDKVSDEDISQAFAQIAERSNGAIAFRTLPWRHRASPLPRQTVDPAALAARRVEQRVLPAERTESFSGLTRHAHDAHEAAGGANAPDAPSGVEADEQARDHDEEASELALVEPTPGASESVVLLDFPRGPRAGNFFHSIFESIDFPDASGEDLLEVVSQKFESFGFAEEFAGAERDKLLASAVRAVGETLDTPLAPLDFRLADVASERRFVELEFRVPVAQAGARSSVSPERLAAAFREHPSAAVPASYADRLEKLGFASLCGFLKGYIDLVFSHGGRWYVVDYKTNHLGDTLGDYGISRMQREMERSHYFLQYHLYTLAVDRFLRRVEPHYDYEKGFGGVFYLFIKGMRPGENSGVFFEKPPAERLHALGSLFDGGAS